MVRVLAAPARLCRSTRFMHLALQRAMITGRQIRVARELLGWSADELAGRARVPVDVLEQTERTIGVPVITFAQLLKIQSVCEAAGIRFNRNDGAVIPP